MNHTLTLPAWLRFLHPGALSRRRTRTAPNTPPAGRSGELERLSMSWVERVPADRREDLDSLSLSRVGQNAGGRCDGLDRSSLSWRSPSGTGP
jgi:hypothetical protein